MHGQTNKKILGNKLQRSLRHNMTDAEQRLWQVLRLNQMGCKFRRQHPYEDFILDFVCLERKLIIEVDGGQHADSATYDQERTDLLEKAGYRVLRFWNNEVLCRLEAVKEHIWLSLQDNQTHPHPVPPLEGDGTLGEPA